MNPPSLKFYNLDGMPSSHAVTAIIEVGAFANVIMRLSREQYEHLVPSLNACRFRADEILQSINPRRSPEVFDRVQMIFESLNRLVVSSLEEALCHTEDLESYEYYPPGSDRWARSYIVATVMAANFPACKRGTRPTPEPISEDNPCPVCFEVFASEAPLDMISLPCNEKHRLHVACLHVSPQSDLTCYQCGVNLFSCVCWCLSISLSPHPLPSHLSVFLSLYLSIPLRPPPSLSFSLSSLTCFSNSKGHGSTSHDASILPNVPRQDRQCCWSSYPYPQLKFLLLFPIWFASQWINTDRSFKT